MRFLVILLVAGCGLTPPVVVPNTQLGENTSQTIGQTSVTQQKLVRPQARSITQTADRNEIRGETVQVDQRIPLSWIAALLIWSIFLWQLPSPSQIGDWVWTKISRKK